MVRCPNQLGFTRLWPDQAAELASRVAGAFVLDIGCGRGELARWMAANGAAHVHAIDRAHVFGADGRRVGFRLSHFHDWSPIPVDVAVVAWPLQYGDAGLVAQLDRVPMVVYVGLNAHNTVCGSAALWAHLFSRELLAHVRAPADACPSDANELSVYGNARIAEADWRPRTAEEVRALVRCVVEARTIETEKQAMNEGSE